MYRAFASDHVFSTPRNRLDFMPKKSPKPTREKKRVEPWSTGIETASAPMVETASDLSVSPAGRQMIQVLVGPADGPKVRAWCRPEERVCFPMKKK